MEAMAGTDVGGVILGSGNDLIWFVFRVENILGLYHMWCFILGCFIQLCNVINSDVYVSFLWNLEVVGVVSDGEDEDEKKKYLDCWCGCDRWKWTKV